MKTILLVIGFAGMVVLHPAYGSATPDQTAAITRAIEVGLGRIDSPRSVPGHAH